MPRTEAGATPRAAAGPLGTALGVLLALALGAGLGWLSFADGRWGWLAQVRLLGPEPLLLNDVPFLGVMLVVLLCGVAAWFLAWVRASEGWDRPVLGLMVFSFFADAVPALFQIALALTLLVLVERALRRGDLPLVLTPLVIPLGLILVSYATTFFQSTKLAPDILDYLFRVVAVGMVALLPVLLRRPGQLDLLFRFMVVSACISTLAAFGQLALSLATGQIVTFGQAAFDSFKIGDLVIPRCTGLMYHPNHASNTLASVAVMALYFATAPRARMPRARRRALLAAYAFLTLGVFITFSRSGWLTLAIATFLIPALRWPRVLPAYAAGLAAVITAGWVSGVLPALYDLVVQLNQDSADFRWHIDRIALHAFREHPWIGIGVERSVEWFNPFHLQVHNTYLQALSEMGLFGFSAFGLLAGWLGWRVLTALRTTREPHRRDWIVALVLASVIILVQNLFEMFLWIKFLWFWIALIEAAVLVCLAPVPDGDPDRVAFLPDVR